MVRYAAAPDEPEPVDAGPDGPKMWSQNLVAIYETDAEIVAAVLPQPLEPTEPVGAGQHGPGRPPGHDRAARGRHLLGGVPPR